MLFAHRASPLRAIVSELPGNDFLFKRSASSIASGSVGRPRCQAIARDFVFQNEKSIAYKVPSVANHS
jgi:hypothetical protein